MSNNTGSECICKQEHYAVQQLRLELAESFYDSLPKRPYATDDFDYGVQIHSKKNAIKKKHLSLNHKYITQWVTFDIDRNGAVADLLYDTTGVQTPNLVVENTENGHAHFLYKLQTPVYRSENASTKPINYLSAIYAEMRGLLGADTAYTGLISKNPMHEHWRTQELRTQPYSLADLARNLDLDVTVKHIAKISVEEAYYEGRNVKLFNELREWSYVAVRDYRGKTYALWLQACIDYCMQLNGILVHKLGYGEIKQIAKSVSKFTWKNDGYCYQEFIDRQTRLGKLGASKGGAKRSASYDPLRDKAVMLFADGKKKKDIALELGVSDRTIRNWLNSEKAESAPKSDIEG